MIRNFEEWWKKYEEFYSKIGVNEAIAHSIWNDAVDTVSVVFLEEMNKKMNNK